MQIGRKNVHGKGGVRFKTPSALDLRPLIPQAKRKHKLEILLLN